MGFGLGFGFGLVAYRGEHPRVVGGRVGVSRSHHFERPLEAAPLVGAGKGRKGRRAVAAPQLGRNGGAHLFCEWMYKEL